MALYIQLQAACIACICVNVGLAALLASSTIEKCVRTGVVRCVTSAPVAELPCEHLRSLSETL